MNKREYVLSIYRTAALKGKIANGTASKEERSELSELVNSQEQFEQKNKKAANKSLDSMV